LKEKKIERFLQSSGENLFLLNSAISEALNLSQAILDQENNIISVSLLDNNCMHRNVLNMFGMNIFRKKT